jgi:glyoxylase-like metal-dependent hydrolase (beta-lactamase superfamily II)
MRTLSTLLLLAAAAIPVCAQQNPVLGEDAVKISEHVWAIMSFPNIAIVTGTRGTLVVDTGLGPRNGATLARVAAKLSAPNAKLYLTTTHFHPEHAAGDAGFPPSTILIRNDAQQREMDLHGTELVGTFSSRNAQWKELLADTKLRMPDVLYSDEAKVDLGGASVRLLWLGAAHTKGDELIFIEPDRTLVSGDVVHNKTVPNIANDGGTPGSWLAVLDKIAALNVLHVLPDHSASGDGSLVTQEKAFITDIRTRAQALKKRGVGADDAGKQISTELKTKYSDWPNTNVANFVKSVYAE